MLSIPTDECSCYCWLWWCSSSSSRFGAVTSFELWVGVVIGLAVGYLAGYWSSSSFGSSSSSIFSVFRHRLGWPEERAVPYDSPLQVLEGALKLLESRWIHKQEDYQKRKVVHYLKPEVMLKTLFHHDEDTLSYPSMSLNTSILKEEEEDDTVSTTKLQSPHHAMLALFSSIVRYSVDTSHPYFFNQLFGASDPVALAAELVATSVNTSVYTYETAPVFTLLEREVLAFLIRRVFGPDVVGDGLMMPGGSLSNLSALHVARQCCLKGWNSSDNGGNSGSGSDGETEEKKNDIDRPSSSPHTPRLVAFVSAEAHYSFLKAASVTGLGPENLVSVPTTSRGVLDLAELQRALRRAQNLGRVPFFVGATAGSTVRGSFDDLVGVVRICRQAVSSSAQPIWVHVDGAWGGPALLARAPKVRGLLRGLDQVDSFTMNPHKMLGAPMQTSVFVSRHENVLKSANSTHAKYLFDDRKHGAAYDLGDASYTCGRRTDAVKLWALLKYYGAHGIGRQVDDKVRTLEIWADKLRRHPSFLLACEPWPFNVNFWFLPRRIRRRLRERGVVVVSNDDNDNDNPVLPDDISDDLAKITVKLKLLMHEEGEMLIPYQPLSNQRADCFRIVLAGQKKLTVEDMDHIMAVMERYGEDL